MSSFKILLGGGIEKYFKRKGMAATLTAALRSYLNCFVVIFEYECPAVQLPLVPSSSSRPLGHAEIESHKKSLLLVAISTWIAEISYFISGLDRDLGIFPWFNTNGTIILHSAYFFITFIIMERFLVPMVYNTALSILSVIKCMPLFISLHGST